MSSWCYSFFLVGIVLFIAVFGGLWHRSFKRYAPPIRSDVLLVFAHPDDEAMFFSPMLMYLRRINVRVHFLCLSNGNFGGLGLVREKELVASANYYGVEPSDVTTINDANLPDGMKVRWDPSYVAQIIRHKIASVGTIQTVVTFDKNGVSSHPNHISCHEGVTLLAKQQATKDQQPILFLQLHTRSLLMKYVGPFALIPYFFGEGTVHPNSFKAARHTGAYDGSKKSSATGNTLEDYGTNTNNSVGDESAFIEPEEYEIAEKEAKQKKDATTSTASSSAASSDKSGIRSRNGGKDVIASAKQAATKYAGGSYGLPWAIIARPKHALSSLEGLKRHTSQLMWFRYLFVFFSTYGYVNELERIE